MSAGLRPSKPRPCADAATFREACLVAGRAGWQPWRMAGKIRKVVAVHEAGHAVIARVLGITVAEVSARSTDPDYAAVVTTRPQALKHRHDHATLIEGLQKDAMIALAGPYAQRRAYPATKVNAHADDLTNAFRAVFAAAWVKAGNTLPTDPNAKMPLSANIQDDAEAIYIKLSDETERMIEEHWCQIERVAKALERHDRLDPNELDRLIQIAVHNEAGASEQKNGTGRA